MHLQHAKNKLRKVSFLQQLSFIFYKDQACSCSFLIYASSLNATFKFWLLFLWNDGENSNSKNFLSKLPENYKRLIKILNLNHFQ